MEKAILPSTFVCHELESKKVPSLFHIIDMTMYSSKDDINCENIKKVVVI